MAKKSTLEEFTDALTAIGCAFTLANGRVEVTNGNVYLASLTALPEGTTFGNSGNVDLRSLTALPEGTTFGNSGYVYLRSLTDEIQTYQGKKICLRQVDGDTMLIISSRKIGDVTVSRARYFGGGDIAKLKPCFIASQGDNNAHGDTVEQAMRDLRFKAMSEDFDCDELVETIKARGTVEFNDFRLITGACESGLRHGMEECGLDPGVAEYPLATVLAKAHGSFGASFAKHFAPVPA